MKGYSRPTDQAALDVQILSNIDSIARRPAMFRRSTIQRKNTRIATDRPNSMMAKPAERPTFWVVFSWIVTLFIPNFVLNVFGIKENSEQAWREKVALCFIALVLSSATIFVIIFFNNLMCPASLLNTNIQANAFGGVVVLGTMYNAYLATPPFNTLFEQTDAAFGGIDVTQTFNIPTPDACRKPEVASYEFAKLPQLCGNSCLDLNNLTTNYNFKLYTRVPGTKQNITVFPRPAYEWSMIKSRKLVVISQNVLNLSPYFIQHPAPIPNDSVDRFLRAAQAINDGTHLATIMGVTLPVIDCLVQKYYAGALLQLPGTCIISRIFSVALSAVVLGIIAVKFFMSLFFTYFGSGKLVREPKVIHNPYKNIRAPRSLFNELDNTVIPAREGRIESVDYGLAARRKSREAHSPPVNPADLFTVLLVTTYSEGEKSIRDTLDCLAATAYDDRKKLLFVISDGLVKGSENSRATPDILIDMMDHDDKFGSNPPPCSYIAVATDAKQHNMAKVYCGSYEVRGRAIPMILIVKCGTPDEQSGSKPGNRGKRDSQLILMNFFSRVILNDRMTPLDYDIFRKMHHVTGVTPDFFDLCLMVDADTTVEEPCLRYMVNAMQNDQSIMGLCGETRVQNKHSNWVTRIQVFEYYISHQMGKAFESVFGGVTCLPGCFSMYRLKTFKDGNLMPILANPDIIEAYSTNEVYTLHQKNLLLLGEDRFLTTLMLRTFPLRKNVYVPQAICRTVVPEDFYTLLSQRRRWINSTIHNLMELIKVRDLCVFMDLLSTAVLPAGLLATYYILFASIFIVNYQDDFLNILNTATFAIVIFMPAIFVLFTGRRYNYVGWMLLYLLSLPIWQLILPIYAFWHFDDFTWGETRKVIDDNHQHGENSTTMFDGTQIPLKRWDEYEREWRKAIVNSLQLQSKTMG